MLAVQPKPETAKSLDHVVLLVRDADAAAAVYERLGFHVRPLAEHEDIGSRNRVVHFRQTYLEFIDFEGAREDVAGPYMDRFQLGEGLVHVSLTSDRLEDDRARLEAIGMQPYPILSARRRITLPDGSFGETASRCFYLWREDNRYLSLFFSDHPKPHMIFIPEFVRHDNGATEVSRCVYMSTTLARIIHEKWWKNGGNSLKISVRPLIQRDFRRDRMLPDFHRISIR
ncbi:MAG: VOC family protein [Haliea sp.]